MQSTIDKTTLTNWCNKHRIDLCMLFGSTVTGKVHPHSDVDVAIYSEVTDLMDLKLRLIGELEDLLQAEIDLTILHRDMSPLLLHEIMLKGKPLFVSNRDIFIEWQMYAIKLYDDVPFLTKYQDLSLKINRERFKDVTGNNKK